VAPNATNENLKKYDWIEKIIIKDFYLFIFALTATYAKEFELKELTF
jgi:hypothetical protein